jgi:hypothetical protein
MECELGWKKRERVLTLPTRRTQLYLLYFYSALEAYGVIGTDQQQLEYTTAGGWKKSRPVYGPLRSENFVVIIST